MKKIKLIAIFLMLSMALAACESAEQTESTEATAETTAQSETQAEEPTDPVLPISQDPAEKYKDVDEFTPEKGVYQIHTIEGVKNMAAHPEAKFTLLCNVDCGGETLPVIPEFTGDLNGAFFKISNFKVTEPDAAGNLGIIGNNKGFISNIDFENVTVESTGNAKKIGLLAGENSGKISRVNIYDSQVTVEKAADGAICGAVIGENTDDLKSIKADVDVIYNAAGKALVGAYTGTSADCKIKNAESSGKLVVANAEGKTAGFIGATAKNVEVTEFIFYGDEGSVGDKIIDKYFAEEENVKREGCSARDNTPIVLSGNAQAMRDEVEKAMRAMGTIEWYVSEPLHHSCSCTLAVCHGVFNPGTKHVGMPYTHKGGSLARFCYVLDENNTVQDWVYDLPTFDGWDTYMGNDCSTAVQQSWAKVANSMDFIGTGWELPARGRGTVAVGNWDEGWTTIPTYTKEYLDKMGEQAMYECYAKILKGDAMLYVVEAGGHTRMAAENAVVVRGEDGTIDPEHSYIVMHEQGAPVQSDPYYTTWRIDYPYTFSHLFNTDTAVPITVKELITGENDVPEASLTGGCEGRAGLFTGIIKANYFLDSVTMNITDASGKEIFNHTAFTTVGRKEDADTANYLIRDLTKEFDLAKFATIMQDNDVQFNSNVDYKCVLTAHLSTGDDFQVAEFEFN